MTADQLELWRKIDSFDIDGGPCDLSFAARLARENGWSQSFADRAVREYKRYVFLAMTAGRHMCPSEHVDQVWHLHLTYTRSYWQRFCGDVLKAPLHHEPTRGGDAEGRKHWAMYADTLLAYEEAFGEVPPADLWPAADQRFGSDLEISRVNRHEFWLVRKPRISKRVAMAGALAVSILFAFGCGGNSFAENGADFLPYLFVAWLMAYILGLIVKRAYKGPAPNPDDPLPNLHPYEIAYLTGGRPRVLATALVRLQEHGEINIGKDGLVTTLIPPTKGLIDRTVFGQLQAQNGQTLNLKPLAAAMLLVEQERFGKLAEQGLIASPNAKAMSRLLPLLLCLGVLGLVGLPRLGLGLQNDRPSGFLIATLIVLFIISMATFVRGVRRTRKADALLANLSKQNGALRRLRDESEPGMAPLAVAMFGAAVLTGTAYAVVYDRIHRFDSTGSGGGCSTSTSSGCGGDGGCGGGGGGGDGGGGGCGGCGGGGD